MLEMFMLHPFINSAGIGFTPTFVEEDGLVEEFEEPAAGEAAPASPLLEALGLHHRNALIRLQIEAALSERGNGIVKGGVNDLVAISRNYGANRIIARFAVVQRRRLARVQ